MKIARYHIYVCSKSVHRIHQIRLKSQYEFCLSISIISLPPSSTTQGLTNRETVCLIEPATHFY